MSKTEYTGGPWIIEGNHILKRDENGQLLRFDSIATVFPCAEGMVRELPPETQANAHLIAAAPELLEALEEMLEATALIYHGSRLEDAELKTRLAIRKAKGE